MSKSNFFIVLGLFFLLLFSAQTQAQSSDAYVLLNGNEKKTSWKKLSKSLQTSELVFFGEEHNCIMAHWLTLQMLKEWTKSDSVNKTFALEMFERDQQASLDSLMAKQFELKDLSKHTRTWSNYLSDYEIFLEFALTKNIPIVASNIPRNYASVLFKNGRDSLAKLSPEEKKWFCPLDFPVDRELSQYRQLIEIEQHLSGKNFVEAQAIKDATMAESIVRELNTGKKVFHLNGRYHSDFKQSILWYVNYYRPNTKSVTISIVRQKGTKLPADLKGLADYIFIVPEDFPVSYSN